MSIKEINSKKLLKEYSIEVPYNEVEVSINDKILKLIPTVSLPGFRKGKAPLNIVRRKYENNVLNEVLEKLVQEKVKKLLEEKKLKIYRQPKVEIKKYVINQPVELNVKIDLEPEIKIFPFEKIESTKYKIDIDKKTSEKNYTAFLSSQNSYKKIANNRSVKKTDKMIVDINTNDDSVPEYIKSQKNIPIITDSDYQVLPDISNKLINKKAKVGEIIKLQFDLKEALKESKEKIVDFEVKINSLEEKTDFKINKDFLSKNNLKSEKELKDKIESQLANQYQHYLDEIEKKQLMDILESKNKFDIPEGILEEEFNFIWHKVEEAKKDNKLDPDDKKLSDDKLRKRYNDIALRRVKLAILIQFIAKNEKIEITQNELVEAMQNYASQYPGQEKQIFEYFKNNPSSIESIRGPIFEKKVVELIMSRTKQKSKKINVDEFNKLQEETFNYKEK